MKSHFTQVNGIRLHYLDHPGEQPVIVLLPGLTANAHAFDGLVRAGLSPRYRLLALDLRGRGLSEQPHQGYTLADHAADVLGLLDALGIEEAVIAGHSFGGMLAIYLAVHHPRRMAKGVVLDAGLLHPDVLSLIGPSLARLGQTWPSFEAYLATMRQQPSLREGWDELMTSFLRADVQTLEDGSVRPHSRLETMVQCGQAMQAEPWSELLTTASHPMLLINAPGAYGEAGSPAIQPEEQGRATAAMLPQGRYVNVPGNHMTMLYGEGAQAIVSNIEQFLST